MSPLRQFYIYLLRNYAPVATLHAKMVKWIFNYRLRREVKYADTMHRLTKRKYYVIPDWRGRPTTLRIKQIDYLKKQGLLKRNLSAYELMKDAYYFTK